MSISDPVERRTAKMLTTAGVVGGLACGATGTLLHRSYQTVIMSLTQVLMLLSIVIATLGCNTEQDQMVETNTDTGVIESDTYVELTDEEIESIVPAARDAEVYTNVIEVHMDESGKITDGGNELTIEDLVKRVTEQSKVEDVQLKIFVPAGTSIGVVSRVQREISDAVEVPIIIQRDDPAE